jgi:hypothetical protein
MIQNHSRSKPLRYWPKWLLCLRWLAWRADLVHAVVAVTKKAMLTILMKEGQAMCLTFPLHQVGSLTQAMLIEFNHQ